MGGGVGEGRGVVAAAAAAKAVAVAEAAAAAAAAAAACQAAAATNRRGFLIYPPYRPYITHFGSFHFIFHYPYITPIYHMKHQSATVTTAGSWLRLTGSAAQADQYVKLLMLHGIY